MQKGGMTPEPILHAKAVSKDFNSAHHSLTVLHDINFEIPAGSTCSIVGPSGSGKTTLLGLCAGLDRASSGSLVLDGSPLEKLDEDQLAELRNRSVGFVFQNFQLLPTLTAFENVMVPAELRCSRDIRRRAEALLAEVGLAERFEHFPSQLSGGEQQRVALARAFID